MKKIIKSLLAVILTSGIIMSCSDKLDINVNPTQPETTTPRLRLPAIISNTAYHLYSQSRYSTYHSYYMTTRTGNSNAIIDNWNYNDLKRTAPWRFHYFDVGSNIMDMIKQAEKDGAPNYVGVGKILLAFSYLTATDVFGDMPYTEAYSASYNPAYDTQEIVYDGVLVLLNEGLAELDGAPKTNVSMDGTTDVIYGGDLENWKSFGLAVKSRLLLHTANFQNKNAEALAVVNEALNNFVDAVYHYPETSSSSWGKNLWGESAAQPEWQFAVIKNIVATSLPTDFLMDALTVDLASKAYDPRLYKLTRPGKNGKYLGAKLSEGLSDVNLPSGRSEDDFANLSGGYWSADNSPFPFILKEELYFIKAELHFHLKQFDAAFEAFENGIKANMKRLGVQEGDILNYLISGKVPRSSSDLKISDIMMQKWIALYWQTETWVDMRRYGYSENAYPNIYYPKYVLAEWGGKWIQRFPYDPETDYVFNPREIARLGAGARNWCFTPVWWAEKSVLK